MDLFIIFFILIVLIAALLIQCKIVGSKVGGALDSKDIEIAKLQKSIDYFDPFEFDDIPTNFPYIDEPIKYRDNNAGISAAQKYNRHIGQRKLLMNEIFFLTKYGHLSDTIVYAGAAPGIHILIVSELFPKHKLLLYDPQPFAIQETDRIKIFTGEANGYFTNDTAKLYGRDKYPKGILFVSDIRSGKNGTTMEEFEKRVDIDNHWMMDWVKIMKPVKAMLKFRLPFTTKENYEYFDGSIDLQPWAPRHSSETRLIFGFEGNEGKKEPPMKKWDMGEYDAKLFYINNFIRPFKKYKTNRLYPEPLVNFDTAYEIYIWKKYFEMLDKKISKNELKYKIADIMNRVNMNIKRDLTGQYIIKKHWRT